MKRREFITLLGGAAAWPIAAHGQQTAVPVVGYISGASREGDEYYLGALRQGLRDTGFAEGRNLTIEARYADNHYERLPMLAAHLIERRVTVMATDPRGSSAAKALTKTIPIVFMSGADPVRNGLVTRLDRPGGNLTGVTILALDLTAKRFGLLRDLVPQATLIGVLADATVPPASAAINIPEVEAAANRLRVPIKLISAGTEGEIDAAFATFAREGVSAVFFVNGFFFFGPRARLNALALRYRMASTGEAREFVESGGLMSYGPSIPGAYRKVGVYVGRILKGEKPGDLPVQLPTKFEFPQDRQRDRGHSAAFATCHRRRGDRIEPYASSAARRPLHGLGGQTLSVPEKALEPIGRPRSLRPAAIARNVVAPADWTGC